MSIISVMSGSIGLVAGIATLVFGIIVMISPRYSITWWAFGLSW